MLSFSLPNWISSRSLAFELAVLFAQRDDLPLGDRDRVSAVRMRHEDLREQIRVILEELGVLL